MNLIIIVYIWVVLASRRYLCPWAVQLDWYDEFECEPTTEYDIQCWGRGSCAGGMINNIGSVGTTGCWGSRSCQDLSVFNGTVQYPADLRSYLALAWTNLAVPTPLGCVGEATCYNIYNTTSDTINCDRGISFMCKITRHKQY